MQQWYKVMRELVLLAAYSRVVACVFVFAFTLASFGGERGVVINEVMYHPPNDLDNLQYVELLNASSATVDISGWSFTKGITFVFPANTRLNPGAFLVVCRSVADFSAYYGKSIPALGDFSGKLSHGGERLELLDAQKKVVDWMKYSDQDGWPLGADGYSASLERICPQEKGNRADNWASSKLPLTKSPAGTPGQPNDSFSTNLPPAISSVEFKPPAVGQKMVVSATVADSDGVQDVALLYLTITGTNRSAETSVAMKRVSGDAKRGRYEATLESQPVNSLVRFHLQAVDAFGLKRFQPAENEPRPAYSFSTFANTNNARIPFGFTLLTGGEAEHGPNNRRLSRSGGGTANATRGSDAFIYLPPDGGAVQTFDFVRALPRSGGFKLHFLKDQTFRGMTTVDIVFEESPRWVLAEPLSYEVYRLAGVPAELTDHLRIWMDGKLLGYYLLIEQPTKPFLKRHSRNDTGELYKVFWQGDGIVGMHKKRSHPTTGHADLLQVIDGLNKTSGAEQWEFIQQNFNVEEIINYFAVNMCIQNWDGFHNNYYAYHDTGGTKKWEMYPWDEDKTWGDFDGAPSSYDWYEMPLTTGMKGDQSPPADPNSKGNRLWGQFGGVNWWRGGGYFSKPLLANPEFRKRFLARLREICLTVFTEEKLLPAINAMEQRLEPEISVRAAAKGQDAEKALKNFHAHIQSFRDQLQNRRKFILTELDEKKP